MPDDPTIPPDDALRLVIPAEPLAVRDGLRALFDTLLLRRLSPDDRANAEIVLAEALNNVVEHAYASGDGVIEVSIAPVGGGLVCRIEDTGAPMPDGRLPAGRLAPPDDLPEGGFGWHLIRTLSQDLAYSRDGGRNRLSFCLSWQQSP